MQSTTIAFVVSGALLAASTAVVVTLLVRDEPGTDPAQWATETLAADPSRVLAHPLHVTPDGCPGFSMSSPVPADQPAGAATYRVTLAAGHDAFWVCLGPTQEVGSARDVVADQLGPADDAVGELVGMTNLNPVLVATPFGEAVRVDRTFGPDAPTRLTDWMVDHGGYLYGFGYLRPTADSSRYEDVEAMIASVVWDS